MDEIRLRRVEGELRDIIAALIVGGEVKDPRVGSFVSVTRVEAARDLSTARVFISTFSADEGDGTELERAVEGLQNAAGYIQAQMGKRLKTRLTPRLHFVADRGIKEGFELNERIKGLFK